MSAPAPLAPAWARLPWTARAGLAALALFAVLVSWLLWPEWRHDPDLSHGLLMPALFVVLLWESRDSGPWRWLPAGPWPAATTAALALAGLSALAVAGLYAAAVGWSHPLVEFILATSLALFLGSAWIALADERVGLLPLNWSAGVAAALWPLCAPIPPGTYTRLTLDLQLAVSRAVLRALQLLGIAAHRHGNIIELARGTVGVEDACSGARSLISCLVAALFFSACLVRRPRRRALLIAASIPLALGMNFVRSLTLTLLANAGIAIAGPWHDVTGYAVLAVSAALLFALALSLGNNPNRESDPNHESSRTNESSRTERSDRIAIRKNSAASPTSPVPNYTPAASARLTPGLQLLLGALTLAAALALFFDLRTGSASPHPAAAPDLAAILPASAPGWTVETRADLSQFQTVLRTDALAECIYLRGNLADGVQIDLYLAYWRPGQVPASFVATHTPDACWPGAGWIAQPIAESEANLPLAGATLAPAECRLFTNSGIPRYVWFWQVYDRRPLFFESPYSARNLLQLAWRYGFRPDADQWFVRVTSNRPWSEIATEPLLREFFARLQPVGL